MLRVVSYDRHFGQKTKCGGREIPGLTIGIVIAFIEIQFRVHQNSILDSNLELTLSRSNCNCIGNFSKVTICLLQKNQKC